MIRCLFFFLPIVLLQISCVAVKGYDKTFLNDPDMVLKSPLAERFEVTYQIYREAATGANGGKTGGGCGCN